VDLGVKKRLQQLQPQVRPQLQQVVDLLKHLLVADLLKHLLVVDLLKHLLVVDLLNVPVIYLLHRNYLQHLDLVDLPQRQLRSQLLLRKDLALHRKHQAHQEPRLKLRQHQQPQPNLAEA
jgi:hypothetical protein